MRARVPKINLDRLDEAPWPSSGRAYARARMAVRRTIREAWRAVVASSGRLVARIDVVADGPLCQLTPLVTCDGVVVRLDLSQSVPFFAFGDLNVPPSEVAKLQSLVFHEFYHLADRLDPDFGMDYHEDVVLAVEKIRCAVNAVWDVDIERRKLAIHRIRPFACFSPGPADPRAAVLANFINIHFVRDRPLSRRIFDELWSADSRVPWLRLVAHAKSLLGEVGTDS